jgi:hypothetical protein
MADAVGVVSAHGQSDSWSGQQRNVLRIWELFRMSKPEITALLPLPWNQLSEEVLCTNDKKIYGMFAHYLLHEYAFETGSGGDKQEKHLRVDPATNYLSTIINLAKIRFIPPSAASSLFFTCLNPKAGTQPSTWLNGVKNQMIRTCFQRSMESGEEIDNSETPLYFRIFCLMLRAYSRHGSMEAADRSFSLLSLWYSAGRSSEVTTTPPPFP